VRSAFVRSFPNLRIETAATHEDGQRRISRGHMAWIVEEQLPDGSGFELVRWAREHGGTTPALLVSGAVDAQLVNRAQLLGVEIAIKPDMAENLRAFIDRARAARSAMPAVRRVVDRFADARALSPRERDVVRAIGQGIPRSELRNALGLSENSVKTLIRRILHKSNTDSLDAILRGILQADGTRAPV
jgi:DNA-binding NarL/FixJ family response regulator